MHDLLHVRREFNEWFERKRKAHAFLSEDVEHLAAICTYEFGKIALNHRTFNYRLMLTPWMLEAMARTKKHLDQLEEMLRRP